MARTTRKCAERLQEYYITPTKGQQPCPVTRTVHHVFQRLAGHDKPDNAYDTATTVRVHGTSRMALLCRGRRVGCVPDLGADAGLLADRLGDASTAPREA